MPKNTAIKLIKTYESNCPFEIAEQKGISIIYEALGGALGYYNCYKRIQFIHINNDLDERLRKFVCAHELGHALLHKDENTPFLKRKTLFSTKKIEIEANTFAVELLLPDEYIYEYKDTSATLKEAAQIYGIPEEMSHFKKINHLVKE
ncbi:ImmA/IrrE family metallo-endopeptidase [Lentibacillus sp. N15]|uniref:ImmA/IrrE family metallo-endopeptidase n=1 Tax=Lentibacillus songyuanensis TaxID=3136161 RepID=UPI0031BB4BB1